MTTPPILGPDDYPVYEEDVTAERIARHLTAVARQHNAAAMPLLYADPASTDGHLYRALSAAYVHEFAVVYLLRAVAERNAVLGHALAVELHRCWADGALMHELFGEWAREHGQSATGAQGPVS